MEITVQPRASKSEIIGLHDGAIRIRIAAQPVDGAANAAIINLFSRILNVRKSAVEIASGASGRRKRVLIHGVSEDDVRELLDCAVKTGRK